MKKLFFTLCTLCLCGTMWADDDDTYRPTDEDEIYVDQSTGLSFYVNTDDKAVLTYEVLSSENYASHDFSSFTIPQTVQADGGSQYEVVEVGGFAFNNCTGIEGELVIPEYINTLGWAAFQNCTKITKVTFDYSSTHLASRCNTTSNYVFAGCESTITEVEMNRDIELGHTTAACSPFLYQQTIATVTFGQHVDGIPNHFFRDTHAKYSIKSVTCYNTYPPSVNSSYDPFYQAINTDCVLYVPEGYVDVYKGDSYWGEKFTNIQIIEGYTPEVEQPEGTLMDVDTHLFFEMNSDGKTVSIIADPVETYTDNHLIYVEEGDYYTFPETVTDVSGVGGNVTRIGENAFENSGISGHLYIPAFITAIGAEAFKNSTHITEVTYEYNATAMSDENDGNSTGYTFTSCSGITKVNIYRDINIGSSGRVCAPFAWQTAIETVNIGPRVTKLPNYMFRQTSNNPITTINCYGAVPPTLGTGVFDNLGSTYTINVPQGALSTYQSAWTSYSNFAEMTNAYAVGISLNNEDGYYATYYNSNAVDIYPPGGTLTDGTAYDVTTYAASGVDVEENDAYIVLSEVGATVPAGVAVLVEANAGGTYTVIETTAAQSASYTGTNNLYGYDTATEISNPSGDYYYYTLSTYNGVLGFWWHEEYGGAFTSAAHKAYLALEQGTLTGTKTVKLKKGDGDETTGISSVEVENEATAVKGIYTLQGVRVSNMNQKGVYIVDGRKVLVK